MTLPARAWVTAALLVVLAVAGEFVGAARRRILRREVPAFAGPPLASGQLLVRVRGEDGRGIPQAQIVQITYPAKPGTRTGKREFLGTNSGFQILPPPPEAGTIRWLEVSGAADSADEPLPFGATLVGPVAEGAGSVEVVLPAERVLSGAVRHGGAPVAGSKVKARLAYPPEFDFLAGTGNDAWQAEATTGSDGRFRLGRLGPGPQEVVFETRRGIAIADMRVESGTLLDIDLATGRNDTVTVVDGRGAPVATAAVAVLDPEPGSAGVRKSRARGFTDPAGLLRIHGLDPAKRYRLTAGRTGVGGGGAPEEMDWTPSDATIRLASLRSVTVRVADENGAPHGGVSVHAQPTRAGRPASSGTTGPDGRCVLQGLEEGRLKLTVKDACSIRAGETVQTREIGGEEPDARFTMPRGAVVSVQISGQRYGPIRALLRDEGSGAAAVTTVKPDAGLVSWHSVDPEATYAAVLIDAPSYQAARVEKLHAGDPTRSVKMGGGTFLMANVQWPEGAGNLKVSIPWGDITLVEANRSNDTVWQFFSLPSGKWVVEASCTVPGRKDRVRASVEASANTTISIQVK